MRPTLEPGLTDDASYEVTADMSPGHLPVQVLSTPSMVGLIEGTCLRLAQAHLDEGETTVGTHICVSHAKAVNVGDSVVVSCELTERDRRRLTFRVGVRHGEAVVSEGTHERFVVGP